MGIILAIVAMLSWGIGDFLIQRFVRSIGNMETLFVITGFGTLVLLPFVWNDIPLLFTNTESSLSILIFAGIILCISALLQFEALRKGKLAVVEPICSLEIIVSALLAYFIIGERLEPLQIVFIVFLILGLMFVSFKDTKLHARHFLEKGVLISLLAAVIMGGANFFMGVGGRLTDAFMINFIASFIMAIVTGTYILFRKKHRTLLKDIRSHSKMLITMSIFDNLAWIAFVAAMALAPIGIVVALTESYILIVVLLGLIVNKERLHPHQKFGLLLALGSAIFLAVQMG